MTTISYSLDTSSVVRAWEFYERIPRFWDSLAALAAEGRVWMVDEALAELASGDLRSWIEECPGLVAAIDDSILSAFTSQVRTHYDPDNFKNGENAADPWVIALALAKNGAVVTEEHLNPRATKRLKIPDVCHRLDVRTLKIHELLVSEDWTF